jgi:hypothetical protein
MQHAAVQEAANLGMKGEKYAYGRRMNYPAAAAGIKKIESSPGSSPPNVFIGDLAIAKEAFHNVSYFGGSFDELRPKIASR